MAEQLSLRGTLVGHTGWVTAIATTTENPDILVSSSRGKNHFLISLNPRTPTIAARAKWSHSFVHTITPLLHIQLRLAIDNSDRDG